MVIAFPRLGASHFILFEAYHFTIRPYNGEGVGVPSPFRVGTDSDISVLKQLAFNNCGVNDVVAH